MADAHSSRDQAPEPPEAGERFVRLFAQNHQRILAYIHSLVPRIQDAEDICQKTSLRQPDDPTGAFPASAGQPRRQESTRLSFRSQDNFWGIASRWRSRRTCVRTSRSPMDTLHRSLGRFPGHASYRSRRSSPTATARTRSSSASIKRANRSISWSPPTGASSAADCRATPSWTSCS